MVKISGLATGLLQENCYVIYNEKHCLIVDPGSDAENIIAQVEETGTKPVAILLTHCHYDHIGALEEIRAHYQVPVYVSPLEQEWLGNPELNGSVGMSQYSNKEIICVPAENEFEIRDYNIEGIMFRVVPTPGHSIGSVSFIFDDFVVVGDALFKGSIGRSDLYTGDFDTLIESITTQLLVLPDDMPVYAGHGDATTIGHEKATNPYLT
ncbi:MBL fold metallo-hydrolase [Listeria booriae]|uniref:MBL fold metallo-hydrolase n=1 Tax=Listeria booriae TaxID=1552123 RepID=A0A7X0YNQ0_9LIST|nr:MBL fold metallo-hydrolase [Listeria booriae]MBC2117587.1 MBL fold metallo-hydrolase [Listeria booriae]MBC2164981.1 MBL fold metallo-hydrolase [Listeria booriae]